LPVKIICNTLMRVEHEQEKKSPFVTLMKKETKNEQETFELGIELAELCSPGSVVALFGELGSGKTRLVQGVCAGLQVKQTVTSPSFTLINEYRGRLPVYHFDFYRLSTFEDALVIGAEEYFYGDGVCLIEWADRIPEILPVERIEVYLEHSDKAEEVNTRRVFVQQVQSPY